MSLPFAFFDDARHGSAVLYQKYQKSCFLSSVKLAQLDDELSCGWQSGWHAVITVDYEYGHALQTLPETTAGYLVLHWFAECIDIPDADAWLQQHMKHEPAGISSPRQSVEHADYCAAIESIQNAIARGETYQINYTTRLHLNSYGDPIKLYKRLRQPVPYATLAYLPVLEGLSTWTLCFSPELFLDIDQSGLITSEPMKGTAPILNDGQDEMRADTLRNDPKNRAENIMIVDLLRNDLSKITTLGGLKVPEPFKVSAYGSVWQMTTAIEAQAKPDTRPSDIIRATFPCGSITGAPKRMSMHIISTLETSSRGLYTGSIGYLKPCKTGLGFYGTLNVVIRTLQLQQQADHTYNGVYGVGSGIVVDSDAQSEYEECGWKARFLSNLRPEFDLFETVAVYNGKAGLLDKHLQRLAASASALNIIYPADTLVLTQAYLAQLPSIGHYSFKITLNAQGLLSYSDAPISDLSTPQLVLLSNVTLPKHDYLRRFKTTSRQIWDQGWQSAEQQGAFDSLFFNQDGVLLEGGRSNVFVRLADQWHTPALDLDILNGVMRQQILSQPQLYLNTHHVYESHLNRNQLLNADEIKLSNALRGLIPVELIIK